MNKNLTSEMMKMLQATGEYAQKNGVQICLVKDGFNISYGIDECVAINTISYADIECAMPYQRLKYAVDDIMKLCEAMKLELENLDE